MAFANSVKDPNRGTEWLAEGLCILNPSATDDVFNACLASMPHEANGEGDVSEDARKCIQGEVDADPREPYERDYEDSCRAKSALTVALG